MFTRDVEKNSSPKTNGILKYYSLYNKVLIGGFPVQSFQCIIQSMQSLFFFCKILYDSTHCLYLFFSVISHPILLSLDFFDSIYSEYLKCIT